MARRLLLTKHYLKAIKKFRAVNPEEQIATLQGQRKILAEQVQGMERKLDAFKESVKEKEAGSESKAQR